MGLGRYDYERRYRRRFWTSFAKVALAGGVLLGIGLFSYQMGIEQLKGRDATLREQIETLSRTIETQKLTIENLRSTATKAQAHAAELETRLQKELPTGKLADLSRLVADRLAAGIDPARLAFVIEQAQNPRNCQPGESKRIVLSTPLLKSTTRVASFGSGAVTVTGEGMSAQNTQGQKESWYDPAQPVTLRIGMHGLKEPKELSGMLPLHHAVIVDHTEYRITVVPGQRSYAEVTVDRCPAP